MLLSLLRQRILQFKLLLNSQDSFHELEQILRSLQENLEPGGKAISTDPVPHNVSDEKLDDKGPRKLQEIPVFKVEFCDELPIAEDILMDILLLHQQPHISKCKEYLRGLRYRTLIKVRHLQARWNWTRLDKKIRVFVYTL